MYKRRPCETPSSISNRPGQQSTKSQEVSSHGRPWTCNYKKPKSNYPGSSQNSRFTSRRVIGFSALSKSGKDSFAG
eukprot:3109354-Pyramimonas_sp.AAC.1